MYGKSGHHINLYWYWLLCLRIMGLQKEHCYPHMMAIRLLNYIHTLVTANCVEFENTSRELGGNVGI